MKFQIRPPSGRAEASVMNQEIIRTRAVITESRLNHEKARELRHTARNLRTISGLMREQIHWRRQVNLTNH
jgi:hypothetical protein